MIIDSATVVEILPDQLKYYIHYDGLDKRMDRWATSEELKHSEILSQASLTAPMTVSC